MDLHRVEDVRARGHHQLVRERGRRIRAAAELGLAQRSSRGRQWGRALGRRRALVLLPPGPEEVEEEPSTGKRRAPKEAAPALEAERGDDHEEEEDDDEVVVEEKVTLLRRLVPGGEDMAVEGLLEETADYIAALKAQVGVMRALTCLLSAGSSDLDAAALRPESTAAGVVVLTPQKPM